MSTLQDYILDAFHNIKLPKDLSCEYLEYGSYINKLKEDEGRIVGYPQTYTDIFIWPGNAFVILASLLDIKGGYRLLISGEEITWTIKDQNKVSELGSLWGNFINSTLEDINFNFQDLIDAIQVVFNEQTLSQDLGTLINNKNFIKSALQLVLSADESMNRKNNYPAATTVAKPKPSIHEKIILSLKLMNDDFGFQLSYSNKTFGAVHYKNSVSQSGISLCSISHNISLIKPEIELKSIVRKTPSAVSSLFNILILPFPLVISRNNFKPVLDQNKLEMAGNFGFFTYEPDAEIDSSLVIECLEDAIKEIGNIDIIALPECSVSAETAKKIADALKLRFQSNPENCPALILGVYKRGDNDRFGENSLTLYVPEDKKGTDFGLTEIHQHKHHRWYLDRNQILNYKLGTALMTNKKWWEYTSIADRSLISYYCQKHNLQVSPLICEDLARQDPVAPVVRSLGPNLIIALLLDGAQIKNRWPGRYAAFLSDDPGSCVLTISPLGMTSRADGTGFPPSRNVAFWSEPNGSKELELTKGKKGIVLTLEKNDVEQWTADGRKKVRIGLTYAGHLCI
ncbi:hypothetical protein Q5705_17920 [Kosakonia sp. H02]|nr:hypothetical protein Q5705_17920 [Kosakonia sp. H02]